MILASLNIVSKFFTNLRPWKTRVLNRKTGTMRNQSVILIR